MSNASLKPLMFPSLRFTDMIVYWTSERLLGMFELCKEVTLVVTVVIVAQSIVIFNLHIEKQL